MSTEFLLDPDVYEAKKAQAIELLTALLVHQNIGVALLDIDEGEDVDIATLGTSVEQVETTISFLDITKQVSEKAAAIQSALNFEEYIDQELG